MATATQARNRQTAAAAQKAKRDQVIVDHLPLVKAIAVRVHENLPVHVDLDDLVHAANQSISQGKIMIRYGVALKRLAHHKVA